MVKSTSLEKRMRKIAKQELNKELETKHKTTTSGAFDYIPSTGVLFNISNVAQGTADNERVGNRITATKLHIQRVFRLAYSATALSNAVRIMVVKSRGGPLVLADMPSYYAPADLDKMYVLDDKMICVTGRPALVGGNADPDMCYRYNYVKKWKNGLNLQYNDTAVISSDNNLYFYVISEVAVNNAEQAGFKTLYYKDA